MVIVAEGETHTHVEVKGKEIGGWEKRASRRSEGKRRLIPSFSQKCCLSVGCK